MADDSSRGDPPGSGVRAPRPPSAVPRPRAKVPAAPSSTPPPVPSEGSAAGEDSLVGTVLLDRVRIVRAIARGGMGRVYLGEQTRLQRQCAVKVLDARLAASGGAGEFARRFLLEASVAAKLTHPNVVTIFDYGETPDGSCFIAMEYLDGRSVSEELETLGRLPPARAVHIATQVGRALREAHVLGAVHRDIKPGNVFLVTRDDDESFVKVLDFGLVKETKAADTRESTKAGQIMGSPRYMAPEQIEGKPVDLRADVYSLGAMLYALLAGRPPFDKLSDLATMMAHVAEAPPPIGAVAPDVVLPPGLEAVVMKCLAKRPDDRYASMDEVLAALRLAPAAVMPASEPGPPAEARAVASAISVPVPSETPPGKRGRAPVVIAAALVVVGAAGAAAFVWARSGSPPPASIQPLAPPPAPTRAAPAPASLAPTAKLHVETDPPGAKVKEEGDTVCESTPCDIFYVGDVADGGVEHLLVFLKSGYKLERKLATSAASPLKVKLTQSR